MCIITLLLLLQTVLYCISGILYQVQQLIICVYVYLNIWMCSLYLYA